MDGLAYVGAEWNLAVGGGGVVHVARSSVRELWREVEGEGERFFFKKEWTHYSISEL
jgi:hypothetical protein